MSTKDLRNLGRDIKKTIIIDNLRENFWTTCPNNGIEIESWYGDDLDDTELLKLVPVLKTMAINTERDVRKVIKHYRADLPRYSEDFQRWSERKRVSKANRSNLSGFFAHRTALASSNDRLRSQSSRRQLTESVDTENTAAGEGESRQGMDERMKEKRRELDAVDPEDVSVSETE